jgi:hypothetical protein
MKIITDEGIEITPTEYQKTAIIYILTKPESAQKKSLDFIYDVIKDYFDIGDYDISNREKRFTYARHIFCFIGYKGYHYSLKEVGGRLNGRDHTTVLSSMRKLKQLLSTEKSVREDVHNICALLEIETPIVYTPSAKKEPKFKSRTEISIIEAEERMPKPFTRVKGVYSNRNYLEEYGV